VTGGHELNNFDPGDGDFAIWGPEKAKKDQKFMGIFS
jgi:hypothetical protein